jgi:hypothetical protein
MKGNLLRLQKGRGRKGAGETKRLKYTRFFSSPPLEWLGGKKSSGLGAFYFAYFSLRLLLTTLTLLSAIADPAIIGLRRNPFMGNNIPAASGIPMIL